MNLIKIKQIASGSLLALALTTGSLVGYAQQTTATEKTGQESGKHWGHRGGEGRNSRHHRHGDAGGMFGQLNLTDAQKEQMKIIAQNYRESTKVLRGQMRAVRGEGFKDDGTFDEAAVRAAAQAQNNIRVELAVAKAKMRAQLMSVLTAEQKTQLEQLKEQRKQQFMQRRQESKTALSNKTTN